MQILMRSYSKFLILTMAMLTIVCCKKTMAQVASEKPVASFYSPLTKEKLAEKKIQRSSKPVINQQLPGDKILPKQGLQAADIRKKKAG